MKDIDDRALNILLRLPNWLGDSVMVSPAFEDLKKHFPNASFSIIGTKASCGIYSRDNRIKHIFIDSTKNAKNRLSATFRFAKEIGKYDIAINFTNSFFSALLIFLTKSTLRIGYAKNLRGIFLNKKIKFIRGIHQVLLYQNLVNELNGEGLITKNAFNNKPLKLISYNIKGFKKNYLKPCIGINPGASYGSAKRWEEKYFIEVILHFLEDGYMVFLFGNDDLSNIESSIKENKNFINLVNKTTIEQLCDYIAIMDLFITNDSGPMHIAASFSVPLIAIFGATDSKETSPWGANAILLNKNLPCSPCKKRECPLKHHNCMKLITPDEVIESAYKMLNTKINDF